MVRIPERVLVGVVGIGGEGRGGRFCERESLGTMYDVVTVDVILV